MELCVFVSKKESVLDLAETLRYVDLSSKKIDSLSLPLIDKEFIVNNNTINTLKSTFGSDFIKKIKRIYFGNETCEKLSPNISQLKTVTDFCLKNNYQLTYVTPYTGPSGLKQIKENLEHLAASDLKDIEVMFNDFGVLNILQKYRKLIPIQGRLLIKTKRDPRFSREDFLICPSGVKNYEKVKKNQQQTFGLGGSGTADYQIFLSKNKVKRISVDLSRFLKIDTKASDLPVDIFWPWTYVTSGRACSIAAIEKPLFKYHPLNVHCGYSCLKYQYLIKSEKITPYIVHKGNTLWLDSTELFRKTLENNFSRLIYQPYIPI